MGKRNSLSAALGEGGSQKKGECRKKGKMITEKAIEKGVNEKKNVGEDKERRGRC